MSESTDRAPVAERSRFYAMLVRAVRWSYRAIKLAGFLAVFYAALVALGMIPVNNAFRSDPEGVEVFVVSTEVHADFILPIDSPVCDWRERFPEANFPGDTSYATHVAIGWGDQGFYIGTPTWDDLRFSTAANALLWPSESCIHAAMCRPTDFPMARSIRLSPEQYGALVDHIEQTLELDAKGSAKPIVGCHYTQSDAFFRSYGHYHCFHTCNSWVGQGLKRAGVRTGWFTPLPRTVLAYLPETP